MQRRSFLSFGLQMFGLTALAGSTPAFGRPQKGESVEVTIPKGWKLEKDADGSMTLTPGDLRAGEAFIIAISPLGKSAKPLTEEYEAAWKEVRGLGKVTRAGDVKTGKTASGWEFHQGGGTVEKGATLLVLVSALRQDGWQFFIVTVTDSAETLQRYTDSLAQVMLSARRKGAPPITPKAADDFMVDMRFPDGWQRADQGLARSARIVNVPNESDRLIWTVPPTAIQGDMDTSFRAIWSALVVPNYKPPTQLTTAHPLRRRLKNGLAVWYEGGQMQSDFGLSYVSLSLVHLGSHALQVLSIQRVYVTGFSESGYAPVTGFLESLRPHRAVPRTPLFRAADVKGTWEVMLIGSSASYVTPGGLYAGDASIGGRNVLTLRGDGTYREDFTGKARATPLSVTLEGVWAVEDDSLILKPRSNSNRGPLTPQRHCIYGVVTVRGKTELLLGSAERFPLNSEELDTFDVATKGPAAIRYQRKE